MTLAQHILASVCKPPEEVGYDDTTDATWLAKREVPQDPLEDLRRAFPNLEALLRGRDVLDFGCGFGDQSGAIAREFKARVTGLDTHLGFLAAARERYGDIARFTDELNDAKFDVVLSHDAMEHYDDPAVALRTMVSALRPRGFILMMFGPPWWAPYGAHMRFFCPIPWVQLWFSERTIMAVRSRYRRDGAKRYEDVESGINKMSLAKFERIIRQSGLSVLQRRYFGVKKIEVLTKIPLMRELTTNVVAAILQK
jgi:SAM-dependent methyltransferase